DGGDDRTDRQCRLLLYALHRKGAQGRGGLWVIKNLDAAEAAAAAQSAMKWFPYQKGGTFRKWYGNYEHVVNWQNDGFEIKTETLKNYPQLSWENLGWKISNEKFYFSEAVTWTATSSSYFAARLARSGNLFDVKGSFAVPPQELIRSCLAFLCSPVVQYLVKCLNPTIETQPRDLAVLPFYNQEVRKSEAKINDCASALVFSARADWDAYERSWDFKCFPLLDAAPDASPRTLEASYEAWVAGNRQTIVEMKRLEEDNNRLFIDAYGLADELNPNVPIDQITLTINPAYRYGKSLADTEWSVEHGFGVELETRFRTDTCEELISYAIGCMMGRYSLDEPGLIYAHSGNEGFDPSRYRSFPADPDGIIPVLDGEWFEDDIVARIREFLAVTFPESSVAENLRFIEDSLGKDIRKYFCSDFYKDHLQTYKKRPIYWMVQSPKRGFACLIYLHRYTKDTLNQVLNNYFRPYLQKLEARLAQLGLDQLNDDLPTRERTAARKEAEKITKVLKECQAWEQDALLPLAQQRIELDLDDGVKVNYLKLQDVLATIPGLAAKED
ncbi:BREX-1 system adenine-specific DNA-methyltransferase PglX, partial [Microcystis elabens FACHB-917]|nr:BREX-1 system adenine-specific DNA-methyltransferase PglX [Microcystis elabens FACHB-917]